MCTCARYDNTREARASKPWPNMADRLSFYARMYTYIKCIKILRTRNLSRRRCSYLIAHVKTVCGRWVVGVVARKCTLLCRGFIRETSWAEKTAVEHYHDVYPDDIVCFWDCTICLIIEFLNNRRMVLYKNNTCMLLRSPYNILYGF